VSEYFFEEQKEQSLIKSAIVAKYFWSWAKVITSYQKRDGKKQRIAYIDLFAGPGRYKNGARSTPLMILEQAIADPVFRNSLVTLFNDGSQENSSTLEQAINELEGIETLKEKPSVYCNEVGEEIVKLFEGWNLIPTLMFVDPWGYKGLSLRLVNSVLKDWACECIFFFNYTRINMGLSNPAVKAHMVALFGEERAAALTEKLKPLSAKERELTIVEELCKALKEMGGKYVLPFGFKTGTGKRTSHHLIFVSKHPLGYGIMKQFMAKESTDAQQGVASFQYNPADRKKQPMLFELSRPLDDLEGMLLEKFAGCTMTVQEVFDAHNVDTPYVMRNYKDILMKMHQEEKIQAVRPGKTIRRNTFPEDIQVTFPEKP
jgi:three-Cys-motif partner protein